MLCRVLRYLKGTVDMQLTSFTVLPYGKLDCRFFANPFQGAAFKNIRDRIMNIVPTITSFQDHKSVLESMRVGSSDCNEDVGWTSETKRNRRRPCCRSVKRINNT